MQANVKLVYQLGDSEFSNHEQPYINILPLRPDQAYEAFSQKELQSIRKTQKVPFSCIRQLILMYTLQNEQVVDVTESALLKQKKVKPLDEYDQKINKICDRWEKEKARLKKLQSLNNKYKDKRQSLVSREYLKDQTSEVDFSEQLKRFVENKEIQKEDRIKRLKPTLDKTSKLSKSEEEIKKQTAEIQIQTNRQILQFIQQKIPTVNARVVSFRQKFQKVGEFKHLVAEYEKVLVVILSQRHIKDREYVSSSQSILTSSFPREIEKCLQEIDKFLTELQKELFKLRMLIKHEKLLSNKKELRLNDGENIFDKSKEISQQTERQSDKLQEYLQNNVYLLILKMLKVIQDDKKTIMKRQEYIMNQYSNFLPGYFNAKEVEIYLSNQSNIDEIITSQKIRLTQHLQNNYGMMVPYTPSEQFKNFFDTFNPDAGKKQRKSYVNILIDQKMQFLKKVTTYINQQYPAMYNLACAGRSEVKNKIRQKLEDFDKICKNQQEPIAVHIIESLRRLQILINK